MPRIILLLLILAALAILAVQNLSTPVSLVILGSSRTPEIPFGLLLVGTLCLGALITLILYALVGLQRPPESKYRPLGRRVPYPENPGSSTSGAPYSPASPYASASSSPRSSSTAFVSEPKIPQDSVSPDSPRSDGSGDSYRQTPFSTFASDYSEPPPSPEPPFTVRKPPFFFRGDKSEKKKGERQDPLENTRTGDDWGERRSAEHLDSWDVGSRAEQNSGAFGQKRGFFDFIGVGNPPPTNTGRSDDGYDGYDEDLDSGWENFEGYDNASPSYGRSDGYPEDRLEGPMDRPLDNRPLDNRGKRIYRDGIYEDRRDEGYEDEDDVYEADYRVIVPPSKPLDAGEDEYRS